MATANSVKTKIHDLIASANSATSSNSADLTDAVAKLIAGFGNAGGSAPDPGQPTFHLGTYTTPQRDANDIVFSTPGGVSNFVMFMKEEATVGTGLAYVMSITANKESGYVYIASSNTKATSSTAAQGYPTGEPTVNNFPGIDFGQDSVTFITYKPVVDTCKLPQAGKTYIWIAW